MNAPLGINGLTGKIIDNGPYQIHAIHLKIHCTSKSHNLVWIKFSQDLWAVYFFLSPENGQAITVTSVSYLEMLKQIFPDNVSTDPDEFLKKCQVE